MWQHAHSYVSHAHSYALEAGATSVKGPANGSGSEHIFRGRITDPTDEVIGRIVELAGC